MPSFRVRVRGTEIDLPVGELTMGRGADCFLRIDDDLVSRRHARLLVTVDTVTIEDLGSRNGSRVNGERLQAPVTLKVGDTFEVGTQAFLLLAGGSGDISRTMLPHRACRICGRLIESVSRMCQHCGALQSLSGSTSPPLIATTGEFEDRGEVPSVATGLGVVSTLGDKLLALGRIEEAERMLAPRLREILDRARAGDLDEGLANDALRRGLRLAIITGRDEWYSWCFSVARFARTRFDARTVDELHTNMMVHKPACGAALLEYFNAQAGQDADTLLYRRRLDALLRFCRA